MQKLAVLVSIHTNVDILIFTLLSSLLLIASLTFIINKTSPYRVAWLEYTKFIVLQALMVLSYFIILYAGIDANEYFKLIISALSLVSFYFLANTSILFFNKDKDVPVFNPTVLLVALSPFVLYSFQIPFLIAKLAVAIAASIMFFTAAHKLQPPKRKMQVYTLSTWILLFSVLSTVFLSDNFVYRVMDFNSINFDVPVMVFGIMSVLSMFPIFATWVYHLKKFKHFEYVKTTAKKEQTLFLMLFLFIHLAGISYVMLSTSAEFKAYKKNIEAETSLSSLFINETDAISVSKDYEIIRNKAYYNIVDKLDKIHLTSNISGNPVLYVKIGEDRLAPVMNKAIKLDDIKESDLLRYSNWSNRPKGHFTLWPFYDKKEIQYVTALPLYIDNAKSPWGYLFLAARNNELTKFVSHKRLTSFSIYALAIVIYVILMLVRQRIREDNFLLQINGERLKKAQTLAKVGYLTINFSDWNDEVSEEVHDMYEITKDDIKTSYLDMMIEQAKDVESANKIKGECVEKLLNGEAIEFEIEMYTKLTRTPKCVYMKMVPVYDSLNKTIIGTEGTIQDITEINEAKNFFKNIIEMNKAPMIVCDAVTAQITNVNDAIVDLYGYSKNDILKMHATDDKFLGQVGFDNLINNLGNSDAMTFEVEQKDISGKVLNLLVSTLRIKHQERVLLFNILFDITHVKEYEKELIMAKSQAEDANNTKSAFLANISHEIRTPLNAILGYSQIILATNKDLPVEVEKQINTIQKNGDHLLNLINNILQMSKIESGATEVNMTIVDTTDLLKDIESMFVLKLKDADIKCVINSNDLPTTILTDEAKVKQIIINLLGNALKFTQEGSITLDMSFNSDTLTFKVIDTGHGISDEEIGKIFAPFEQSEAGRKFGGTGLGLSICKTLTALLGGNITAYQNPDKGTTFEVNLPIETYNYTKGKRNKANPEKIIAGIKIVGEAPLVLVADDVEANREILTNFVEKIGVRTIQAVNGLEAIEQNEKHKPDLIFMDIRMPELDGIKATKRIREAGYDIPVVAVTASVFSEEKDKFFAAGLNDCVIKPFKDSDIYNAMKKYLKLEYLYADVKEDNTESVVEDVITIDDFKELAEDQIMAIKDAVLQADLDEVMNIVDSNEDKLSASAIKKVKVLVENYEQNKLKDLFDC